MWADEHTHKLMLLLCSPVGELPSKSILTSSSRLPSVPVLAVTVSTQGACLPLGSMFLAVRGQFGQRSGYNEHQMAQWNLNQYRFVNIG